MLRGVIARSREGGKSVRLSVGLKNERAYRLYQRSGLNHAGPERFQHVERSLMHTYRAILVLLLFAAGSMFSVVSAQQKSLALNNGHPLAKNEPQNSADWVVTAFQPPTAGGHGNCIKIRSVGTYLMRTTRSGNRMLESHLSHHRLVGPRADRSATVQLLSGSGLSSGGDDEDRSFRIG